MAKHKYLMLMGWNGYQRSEGTWCEEVEAESLEVAESEARERMFASEPTTNPKNYYLIRFEILSPSVLSP